MIYVITFCIQLVYFIIGDIVVFILMPYSESFYQGHNFGEFYKNKYGLLKSNANTKTHRTKWVKGKYKALLTLKPTYWIK